MAMGEGALESGSSWVVAVDSFAREEGGFHEKRRDLGNLGKSVCEFWKFLKMGEDVLSTFFYHYYYLPTTHRR